MNECVYERQYGPGDSLLREEEELELVTDAQMWRVTEGRMCALNMQNPHPIPLVSSSSISESKSPSHLTETPPSI